MTPPLTADEKLLWVAVYAALAGYTAAERVSVANAAIGHLRVLAARPPTGLDIPIDVARISR